MRSQEYDFAWPRKTILPRLPWSEADLFFLESYHAYSPLLDHDCRIPSRETDRGSCMSLHMGPRSSGEARDASQACNITDMSFHLAQARDKFIRHQISPDVSRKSGNVDAENMGRPPVRTGPNPSAAQRRLPPDQAAAGITGTVDRVTAWSRPEGRCKSVHIFGLLWWRRLVLVASAVGVQHNGCPRPAHHWKSRVGTFHILSS